MFDRRKIIKVYIDGMKCNHCKEKVEETLSSIKNIKNVNVNLDSKCATITYTKKIDKNIIREKINNLDYNIIKIEMP